MLISIEIHKKVIPMKFPSRVDLSHHGIPGALLLIAVLVAPPCLAEETGTNLERLDTGREHMTHGRFIEAAESFEGAAQYYAKARNDEGRLRAMQALAEARLGLGLHHQAIIELKQALAVAETKGDRRWTTLLQAQLGNAYLKSGSVDAARPLLVTALAAARVQQHPAFTAAVLNDLGVLHRLTPDNAAARDVLDEACHLAQETNDNSLILRTWLNAATLALEMDEPGRAHKMVQVAQQAAQRLEAQPHLQAQGWVRSGLILAEVARLDPGQRAETTQAAHTALRDALRLANSLQEPRLVSAASGALGGIYMQANRRMEALTLTHQAILAAQRAGAAELLFRWHWQAARLHRAEAHLDQAIAAYRLALAAYETSNFSPVPEDFNIFPNEPAHTVFLELADLLLQKSGTLGNGAEMQKYLIEARDAVELLKARELQDYFRDSCVAEARARVKTLVQTTDPGTAVLYPIVLPDRLELLLSVGAEIKRFTVSVRQAKVTETAREFREAVQSQRTRAYLAPAQTLYQWLILPIEKTLAATRIDTLVTIPDHTLRAIPMAALHDGQQFLGNRLAVALVPGLTLTDPRPLPSKGVKTLLAGLTESVQGYSALVHVGTELDNIGGQFTGHTLKNETFVRKQLERELTREHYSIAHIASHGEFTGNVRDSFVLAYDSKISVDDLARYIGVNRFRDDPLDLLTLSACQTAAGDERAMLGLAGITVKAGVRSALASLWPIHDEATSLLMSEFYRQLQMPGVSKALALQRAQQKLAATTRYRHPGYWSGFVLIGSWQ